MLSLLERQIKDLTQTIKYKRPKIRRTMAPSLVRNTSKQSTQMREKRLSKMEVEAKEPIRKKHEKVIEVYEWSLEFYRTNQEKLLNSIKRELKRRNYFFQTQLYNLMKSKDTKNCIETVNLQKYQNELDMLIQFLINFYQKRKIKEISILHERLQEEEKFIRSRTGINKYDQIYHMLSLGKVPSTVLDLQEQYQSICMSYGKEDKIVNPHKNIKNSLQSSTKKLYKIFEDKIREKGSRQFVIKQSRLNHF